MRPASEIVEAVVREVLASAGDTTVTINERASEFLQVAHEAPAGSAERMIASAIAHKLHAVVRSVTLQRFTL